MLHSVIRRSQYERCSYSCYAHEVLISEAYMVYKPCGPRGNQPQDNQDNYFFHSRKIPQVLPCSLTSTEVPPPLLTSIRFPGQSGFWDQEQKYTAYCFSTLCTNLQQDLINREMFEMVCRLHSWSCSCWFTG